MLFYSSIRETRFTLPFSHVGPLRKKKKNDFLAEPMISKKVIKISNFIVFVYYDVR